MATTRSTQRNLVVRSGQPPVELSSWRTPQEFADFHLRGATPQNVMKRVLILNMLVDTKSARTVIARAASRGLISKKRFKLLYSSQADDRIEDDPLFRLCDYARYVGKDGAQLFTFEELLSLEESRHGHNGIETNAYAPCEADVAFFVRDDTNRKKLPSETLKRYSHSTHNPDDNAIIQVELIRRKVIKITQDDLRAKLLYAAKTSPQGNGFRVYLALILGKPVRKGSAWDVIADTVIELMLPTISRRAINLSEAKEILALYLYNPAIPDEDKARVKAKVQESCDIFSRMYKEFVKDVEEGNPLRLKK
jgi:hypothetical protein